MRFILLLFVVLSSRMTIAQNAGASVPLVPTNQTLSETLQKDSVLVVTKNPKKGFHHDYILFIPKGTPLNKTLFLLVEPNNTGKTSDDMTVHKEAAIHLASVSSVGNNIAGMLKIPLLVPVFPRPASQPLVYTHALDRDVMHAQAPELQRPDLQLLAMITDAKSILAAMQIQTAPRFFMNGFSASATFTNRFSLLHPEKIQALAIGGFNGELMLPQNKIKGIKAHYPIGTADFRELFGKRFDGKTYQALPQFIYMGAQDDNDAVQFDDAYDDNERNIINENLGRTVPERYVACQKIYQENKIYPIFKTYENVGHFTTREVSIDVIGFFLEQMRGN